MRCAGLVQITIEGCNGGDAAAAARGKSDDRVALADSAGGDLTGEAAVVLVGANDALDWQTKGLVDVESADWNLFEMFEQRGTVVPRGAQAALDDVVAIKSADRDGDETGVAKLPDQSGEIDLDLPIDRPRKNRRDPSC